MDGKVGLAVAALDGGGSGEEGCHGCESIINMVCIDDYCARFFGFSQLEREHRSSSTIYLAADGLLHTSADDNLAGSDGTLGLIYWDSAQDGTASTPRVCVCVVARPTRRHGQTNGIGVHFTKIRLSVVYLLHGVYWFWRETPPCGPPPHPAFRSAVDR